MPGEALNEWVYKAALVYALRGIGVVATLWPKPLEATGTIVIAWGWANGGTDCVCCFMICLQTGPLVAQNAVV